MKQLIICKSCPMNIDKKAKQCPYCNAKQQSKAPQIAAVFIAIIVISLLTSIPNNRQRDHQQIEQLGYFKSHSKHRIFTLTFTPGTQSDAIKEAAAKLPHTAKRMTAAYFYPQGSIVPQDGITLANSITAANTTLYELNGLSKWRYAHMKFVDGSTQFIDCIKNHDNDLCRK